MSQKCELTGITGLSGNKVSHANNKTRTRQEPNIMRKRYMVNGQPLRLHLSTRAIRTISKLGTIEAALLKSKPENLSLRLQRAQRKVAG